MWLSKNGIAVALAVLVTLGLSSCGFRPVGQQQVVQTASFSQVFVLPIANREGQLLRNALTQRFNPYGEPSDPRYHLRAQLSLATRSLGVRAEGDTTRAQRVMTLSYDLINALDGNVLDAGTLVEHVSYNVADYEYLDDFALESAHQRGIEALAEQLERRLALFFQRQDAGRQIVDEQLSFR